MTRNQVKNFSMLHFYQISLGSLKLLVLDLDLPLDIALLRFFSGENIHVDGINSML